jgi:hypothetical protein
VGLVFANAELTRSAKAVGSRQMSLFDYVSKKDILDECRLCGESLTGRAPWIIGGVSVWRCETRSILGRCCRMAFALPLPAPWTSQQWKLKIRDRERLEPPHVTLLHRTRAWRWDLRSGGFMDVDPPPSDVPVELVQFIERNLRTLRSEWDRMYPRNPVTQKVDDV